MKKLLIFFSAFLFMNSSGFAQPNASQRSDQEVVTSYRYATFDFEQFKKNLDLDAMTAKERTAIAERLKHIKSKVDAPTSKAIEAYLPLIKKKK